MEQTQLTVQEYDALIEFLNRGYVRPTEVMYLQSILSKIAPKSEPTQDSAIAPAADVPAHHESATAEESTL